MTIHENNPDETSQVIQGRRTLTAEECASSSLRDSSKMIHRQHPCWSFVLTKILLASSLATTIRRLNACLLLDNEQTVRVHKNFQSLVNSQHLNSTVLEYCERLRRDD